MNRKLRMGMVGGGSDAFIGAIHRLAHLWMTRSNWSAVVLALILRFRSLQENLIFCLKVVFIKLFRRCLNRR